jgi:hypothetical protein
MRPVPKCSPRIVWYSSWTIPKSLNVIELFIPWLVPQILPLKNENRAARVIGRRSKTMLHTSRFLIYLKDVTAVVTHSVSLFRWSDSDLCPGSFLREFVWDLWRMLWSWRRIFSLFILFSPPNHYSTTATYKSFTMQKPRPNSTFSHLWYSSRGL